MSALGVTATEFGPVGFLPDELPIERIELRRVCEPLVHQLNIVPAARGVSMVTSFFAPFHWCDARRR